MAASKTAEALEDQLRQQAGAARGLLGLTAELIQHAKTLPIDQRDRYEMRIARLASAASVASGQATRAAVALADVAPPEVDPLAGLSDDDLRAELEALEGQALRVVGG